MTLDGVVIGGDGDAGSSSALVPPGERRAVGDKFQLVAVLVS